MRGTTRHLIDLARHGDTDGAALALAELVNGPEAGKFVLRTVLAELTSASARMLSAGAGGDPEETAFRVEIRGDADNVVPIDELDPPLRAAVRALLAQLNGSPEDAEYQLDLTFREKDPVAAMTVLVHALLWTADLYDSCEQAGVPTPEWLHDASAR
ncbi:hypothetical protein [Goodfellowiella coeruleoviolacea]|uniref:hypothetical protein n=1 Tax=Goodfellowiella coeruleoviolacea TaxID=334858 RepID=UPI0020A5EA10|nr:hypothetical protein [Goodfellowiella coeruleoviolacea]